MEEDTKEYAFRLYVAKYTNMDKKTFITFNEYWEKIKPKEITMDQRSEEEIMQEILMIEESFKKGGET